ncbi:MAG: restriction endonuclease subunit S, partial [Acidimicrobiia bacterium]
MASTRRQLRNLLLEDIAAGSKNAMVGGPFGSNLVVAEFTGAGVPVIRGQNMGHGRWVSGEFVFVSEEKASSLSANIARPGDVIFTQRGTLGQVALVPPAPYERYIVSQSQMKLTADDSKADPMYIYYLFKSPALQSHIHRSAIRTGVPHTNLRLLRETPIALPSIEVQRQIAEELGLLDAKIELNLRMLVTLEATARAIFKSWFVDFDPVRESSMAGDIRQLFPERLVDSAIGRVPSGWQVAPLGLYIEVLRGLSYAGIGLATEGMPLHNLDSISEGGGYKESGIKYYVGEYRERHCVRAGDVIVANTEQGFDRLLIGYPAIVPRSFGQTGLYSHHLYRVRPVEDAPLTAPWLYLLLVGSRMHQQV